MLLFAILSRGRETIYIIQIMVVMDKRTLIRGIVRRNVIYIVFIHGKGHQRRVTFSLKKLKDERSWLKIKDSLHSRNQKESRLILWVQEGRIWVDELHRTQTSDQGSGSQILLTKSQWGLLLGGKWLIIIIMMMTSILILNVKFTLTYSLP